MLDRNSCRAGAKLAASGDNGQALQGRCTGADGVRKPRSTRSEFVVVKRACGFEHRDMVENFDSGRRPKHQQALD